jgi:uncharacterized membrane protein YedE/YeeE
MIAALIGGALIGLAATMLLASHGKVAGVAGIFGRTLMGEPGTAHGPWFLAGLFLAGVLASALHPTSLGRFPSLPIALAAGLLVGFGVRLGNGCTSGHGVCGISRLRKRSIAATLVFMGAGFITVFVTEHLL